MSDAGASSRRLDEIFQHPGLLQKECEGHGRKQNSEGKKRKKNSGGTMKRAENRVGFQ